MAEGVIIHFRVADRRQVAVALDGFASRWRPDGDAWRYPRGDAEFTLTVYPYDDLRSEYEPEEIEDLEGALGGSPQDSLAIELRRSRGNEAVDDTVWMCIALLRTYAGVVDDTYSELWRLEEIESGVEKSDGHFLDCYRRP